MLRQIEKTIEDFDFDTNENQEEPDPEIKCLAPATLKKNQVAARVADEDLKAALLFFKNSSKFCDLENSVIKKFAKIYCLFFFKYPITDLDFHFDPVKMGVQVRRVSHEQDANRIDSVTPKRDRIDEGFGDDQDLV